ncbi:unnamed protein product [Protopolystoma xenopodis]|uniref:Uncharacterized protein n=1 Tax=Protopolystoma xenopodis TaxID=117903 RepID=A0A3S5B1G3_9PLAT|nr:unnamed protein product [Protopolystoma xenopodis]
MCIQLVVQLMAYGDGGWRMIQNSIRDKRTLFQKSRSAVLYAVRGLTTRQSATEKKCEVQLMQNVKRNEKKKGSEQDQNQIYSGKRLLAYRGWRTRGLEESIKPPLTRSGRGCPKRHALLLN